MPVAGEQPERLGLGFQRVLFVNQSQAGPQPERNIPKPAVELLPLQPGWEDEEELGSSTWGWGCSSLPPYWRQRVEPTPCACV